MLRAVVSAVLVTLALSGCRTSLDEEIDSGMTDGREFEESMDASRGSRENPMSEAELYEKFSANAGRALPADRARAVWDAGMSIDRMGDVRSFADLLAAPRGAGP